MEYNHALARIEQIHDQIVAGQRYRGFRSATVAATGVIALAAMLLEQVLLPHADLGPWPFIALWSTVAALSVILTTIDIMRRYQKDTGSRRRTTLNLLEQFLPVLIGSAAFSFVAAGQGLATAWLPPLWALTFGFGILSVRRFFAKAVSYAGYFYVVAACGAAASQNLVPPTIVMGAAFGIGQMILSWCLAQGEDA